MITTLMLLKMDCPIKKKGLFWRPLNAFGQKCLRFLSVFLLELLHTAGSVHEHFLASIEWMWGRTYLDLNYRVFFAICPLVSFIWSQGRAGQKLKIAWGIPKNNLIVCWMYLLLHSFFFYRTAKIRNWCLFARPCPFINSIWSEMRVFSCKIANWPPFWPNF